MGENERPMTAQVAFKEKGKSLQKEEEGRRVRGRANEGTIIENFYSSDITGG